MQQRVREAQYTKHTVGWGVAVAPPTVAEARYSALNVGCGQRQLSALADLIDRVRMLPVDPNTVIGSQNDRGQEAGNALAFTGGLAGALLAEPESKAHAASRG